jgi:tRNA(Ile)-lysidine synthase
MRARSGDLLRPLLAVSRQQVLQYLAERGLPWREDPSNADPAFARNRVRHELLPYLESRFNPAVRQTLARTASLLADEEAAVAGLGRGLRERAGRREGPLVVLDRAALAEAPRAAARAAVREALRETGGLRGVGLAHVDRVLDLAASDFPSGRRLPLPGGRAAWFRFGEVAIGPRREPARPFAVPLTVPGRISLPEGGSLEALSVEAGTGSNGMRGDDVGFELVAAPADAALTVRTRRPGDRIRTRGRQVSLRRFLMDRRVPAELRERLPLVAAGSDVLWVAGVPARDGAAASVPSGPSPLHDPARPASPLHDPARPAARLVGLRLVADDGRRGTGSPA